MNQSQFLAITCNSLGARENSCVHGAIDFGFDSHWLKNWRESFKPITKGSNRNRVITFDSHLKTALIQQLILHLPFKLKDDGREASFQSSNYLHSKLLQIKIVNYYMALSHEDWELQNSRNRY